MTTYAEAESSVQAGQPFYLYQFTCGEQVWRFTSRAADWTTTVDGAAVVWAASALAHGEITLSSQVERGSLSLTFPLSDTFALSLLRPTSSKYMVLTIFRGHEAVPDTTVVHWKGRVMGAETEGRTIVATCESLYATIRRQGCRAKYQSLCRHILYRGGCGLDIADFYTTATVTAVSGAALTVPGAADQADGWFAAGVLKYGTEYGFILTHSGSALGLGAAMPSLVEALAATPAGVEVQIAPGCDLRETTCEARFANLLNYGGFTRIPGRNPFGGSSIV